MIDAIEHHEPCSGLSLREPLSIVRANLEVPVSLNDQHWNGDATQRLRRIDR